jgi:hypothetical protein
MTKPRVLSDAQIERLVAQMPTKIQHAAWSAAADAVDAIHDLAHTVRQLREELAAAQAQAAQPKREGHGPGVPGAMHLEAFGKVRYADGELSGAVLDHDDARQLSQRRTAQARGGRIVRRLVGEWREAPDAAADGHSATQTGEQT